MSSYHRTHTEIDVSAIYRNAKALKRHARKRVISVVKADAYGHGAVRVAETLAPITDMFAVATVEEGRELREAGIDTPILVLFTGTPADAEQALASRLIPTIAGWDFAETLDRLASDTVPIPVHVNINTGMNRSGVPWRDAPQFLRRLQQLRALDIEGLFTHFATADMPDKSFVSVQCKRFAAVLENAPARCVHAANSAATLALPTAYFDAVRPGLSLYGIYPGAERPIALEPALTWKSRVGWTGSLSAGEGVSYGLKYTAQVPTDIAMVEVGYGDGYPRSLSRTGEVLIGGVHRRIIGRICMDVTVVALSPGHTVSEGDEVVLIGKQRNATIGVEAVAARAGTIPYEILTQIGRRVPRVYTP